MLKKKFMGFEWSLLPTVVVLAWPTMLEQLLQTAVQYIDTAMVGSLGTDATAAVGATGTVGWLVISTISALSVGLLSIVAQAHGAGDRELAKRAAAQATFIILSLGVVFTAVILSISHLVPVWMQVDPRIRKTAGDYFFSLYIPMLPRLATVMYGTLLRSVGDTKTPMRVGLIVNVTNVVLNFLLIYPTRTMKIFGLAFTMPGAGMGVIGAAVASAAAFTVGGILITIVVWRHPEISPKGQSLKPDLSILKPTLRIALPNMFQRFGTSLGFVVFASMINSLGGVSTATHTIANTVESAFYIPGFGMQTAAATLTGNAVGAKDKQRLKDLARLIIFIEVALMIVTGSLLFIFAPNMVDIFTDDPAVIALGATVLRMVAVSEPFYGVSIIIEGMLQGVGQTVIPFVCSVSGMWGIRILGTFITTQIFSFGLVGAWACMIAHNLLVFTLYIPYYFSGRWNPLLEHKKKRRELTAAGSN